MTGDRLFLDTSFVLATLNRRDAHHTRALALVPRVAEAREVVVTESVLVELGDGLSRDAALRGPAVRLIRGYYAQRNCTVVPTDTALVRDALALYARHDDKAWGLTDSLRFSPRGFARFIGEPLNAALNSGCVMPNSSRASGRASLPASASRGAYGDP